MGNLPLEEPNEGSSVTGDSRSRSSASEVQLPKRSSGSISDEKLLESGASIGLDSNKSDSIIAGRVELVSKDLLKLLSDKEQPSSIRRAAIQTARFLDNPEVLATMKRVVREEGYSVPLEAARWIALSDQKEAQSEAISMLRSEVSRIRTAGAWSLLGARTKAAEAALMNALHDKNPSVQIAALSSLSARSPDNPLFKELSKVDQLNIPNLNVEVCKEILGVLAGSTNSWQVRLAAARALPSDLKEKSEISEQLVEAYNNERMPHVKSAILEKFHYKAGSQALIELARTNPHDPKVRNLLVDLAQRNSEDIIDVASDLIAAPESAFFDLGAAIFQNCFVTSDKNYSEETKKSLRVDPESVSIKFHALAEHRERIEQEFKQTTIDRKIDIATLIVRTGFTEMLPMLEDFLNSDSIRREGAIRNAIAKSLDSAREGSLLIDSIYENLDFMKGKLESTSRQKLIIGLSQLGSTVAENALKRELELFANKQAFADFICSNLPDESQHAERIREEIEDLPVERFANITRRFTSMRDVSKSSAFATLILNGRYEDKDISDTLDLIAGHLSENVRSSVAKALADAQLSPEQHPEVVRQLLAYLSQDDEKKKIFAIQALAGSQSPIVEDMLIGSVVRSSKPEVASALLEEAHQLSSPLLGSYIIEMLGESGVEEAGLSDPAFPGKLEEFAKNIKFTKTQAQGLVQIASNPLLDAAQRVFALAALESGFPLEYFRCAAEILAQTENDMPWHGDADVDMSRADRIRKAQLLVLRGLKMLFIHEDHSVSSERDRELVNELIDQVIDIITHEDHPDMQHLASEALQHCYLLNDSALNRLMEAAQDTLGRKVSEMGRYYAHKALCGVAHELRKDIHEFIVSQLAHAESNDMKADAAFTLANSEDEKPLELYDLLESDSLKLQRAVARGLVPRDSKRYTPKLHAEMIQPLIDIMKNGGQSSRKLAAQILLGVHEARRGR